MAITTRKYLTCYDETANLTEEQVDAAVAAPIVPEATLWITDTGVAASLAASGHFALIDGVRHAPECDKTMYGSLAAANVLCTCDNPHPRTTSAPVPVGLQRLTPEQCLEFYIGEQRDIVLGGTRSGLVESQREAASAAWSAQLRAKVQESEDIRHARQPSVVIEHDVEDLPWRTW